MKIGIMMGTSGSSTIDDLVGMAKSAEEVGWIMFDWPIYFL